ncbi:MAG: glycosyltransferase family 39 protein [Clostridia bacterium]
MKKILNKDYILFGILFLIAVGIGENINIAVSDELWNFQNIYKIYNGYGIYEGANIIITPLFFYIGNFIFKIFGANFLVFRLYNCILVTILFFIIYKILKELIKNRKISFIITMLVILYGKFFIISLGANYNTMALGIVLIGIYLLITNKIKNMQLVQGIITGLIFFTKQNIGVYYGLAYFIYLIFTFDKKNEKIKDVCKNIFKYFLGILLVGSIFLIELILNNKIYGFIDYTILGMSEFSIKNIGIEWNSLIFFISIFVLNIIVTKFLIKKGSLNEIEVRNLKIFLPFSIILALWAFPIFNKGHIFFGIIISVINLLYCVYIMFKDIIKENRIVKIVYYGLIICLLIFSTSNFLNWYNNITSDIYQIEYSDPYFGTIINNDQYKDIEEVTSYIKNSEKNTIILSEKAGLYMIPLNRSNGKFDLPLLGNLGKKGEDGLIEEIKNLKNMQILLYTGKGNESNQEPEKAIEYVRNNWTKIDSVNEFDVYIMLN